MTNARRQAANHHENNECATYVAPTRWYKCFDTQQPTLKYNYDVNLPPRPRSVQLHEQHGLPRPKPELAARSHPTRHRVPHQNRLQMSVRIDRLLRHERLHAPKPPTIVILDRLTIPCGRRPRPEVVMLVPRRPTRHRPVQILQDIRLQEMLILVHADGTRRMLRRDGDDTGLGRGASNNLPHPVGDVDDLLVGSRVQDDRFLEGGRRGGWGSSPARDEGRVGLYEERNEIPPGRCPQRAAVLPDAGVERWTYHGDNEETQPTDRRFSPN